MDYADYYLAHHGVKGQKWGVRRYQNEDGSLTPAGKKRLRKLERARDMELRRARWRMAEDQELKKNNEAYLKELEAEGSASKTFQDRYGVKNDQEAKLEYGVKLKTLLNREVKDVTEWTHITAQNIRAWQASEKALMGLSLDDLSMSKRDVVNVGRTAMSKARDEYEREHPGAISDGY